MPSDDPLETSWISDGDTVTVITERGVNQTRAEWEQAHTRNVASMKEDWPVD